MERLGIENNREDPIQEAEQNNMSNGNVYLNLSILWNVYTLQSRNCLPKI